MARMCILLALMAMGPSVLKGQAVRGVFCHVYAGSGVHFSPSMQRDLRSPAVLGKNLQINRIALLAGGNAFALRTNRMLLGGSAIGYRVTGATARGGVSMLIVGAGLKLGYLISFRHRLFSYPYVGVGANGTLLKVSNGTDDQTFLLTDQAIPPGRYTRFLSRGVNFDAGYSFEYVLFPLQQSRTKSGAMISVQAGALIFAGIEDWHVVSAGHAVPLLAQALSFSPYIRLSLGLGAFNLIRIRTHPRSFMF
jgi:hypothetical protein